MDSSSSTQTYQEYQSLFGSDNQSALANDKVSELLRRSWQGATCSPGLRCLVWRIYLGLVSKDRKLWPIQLNLMTSSYKDLKARVMPSLDKVKADPLSGLVADDTESANNEWNSYYKNVELINFIKGDLDRLYLSGIDDDYFQSKFHRDLLLAILFIWSQEHPAISYRQGMHEIVGTVLFVIDNERKMSEKLIREGIVSSSHPTFSLLQDPNNIEAFTFALFDRIMLELDVLYDPLPVQGNDSQPFVVHYCAKIQGS
jgi:TBC1 domain family protein 5